MQLKQFDVSNISKKERKFIMNRINETEVKKQAEQVVFPKTNFAIMVPEDERAVEMEEAKEISVVLKTPSNLALSVPEDERAEIGEPDNLAGIESLDCFGATAGMVQIVNALDDKLYARVYVSPEGVRSIEFCEQYSDGRYSPRMMVEQSDLLLAARYNFVAKGIPERAVKSKISKFMMKVMHDYLGRYDGPEEELDIISILNTLLKVRAQLPVYRDVPKELTPKEFYRQVIEAIKTGDYTWVDEHKAYYTLDRDQIDRLEKDLGLKRNELLPKLKMYGFLYLTDSCRGYQSNIRFKNGDGTSSTEWVYCIYKMEYFVEQNK